MSNPRLLYIDNLRTLVIIMVILVHLAVTYGGEGSWYYKEGRADTPTSIVLTIHNAISQSFFMGLPWLPLRQFPCPSCWAPASGERLWPDASYDAPFIVG
jgi:hypothetical protein